MEATFNAPLKRHRTTNVVSDPHFKVEQKTSGGSMMDSSTASSVQQYKSDVPFNAEKAVLVRIKMYILPSHQQQYLPPLPSLHLPIW
jgi:hypothetical protein